MSKYPSHLLHLIGLLKRLPGVGSKTAERFAFHLLSWPEEHLRRLSELTHTLKEAILQCPECRCLMEEERCGFCDGNKRDCSVLCIISCAKDAYAVEDTRAYRGLYHVIEGLLSPLDGRTPDHLNLTLLTDRLKKHPIQEVIIALDSTIEGDATALYLKEHLGRQGLRVSRLAFGLPMGSPLEYVDGGTLSRALAGRQSF